MRAAFRIAVVAVVIILGLAPALARADTPPEGYIVLQLRQGASFGAMAATIGADPAAGDSADGLYRIPIPVGADAAAELALLQATPGVASAELDQVVQADQSSQGFYEGWLTDSDYGAQTGLTLIHAAQAQQISQGQDVTVAVLDTGASFTQPALAGHLVPGYDVLDPGSPPADALSPSDSDPASPVNGAVGHGTAVAGIVAATAPGASIMPIKVLDSQGIGSVYGIAEGIYYAVDHGAQVINLSLGMAVPSPAVAAALAYAAAHDVVVVAAAGNTGLDAPTYPAGDPTVLSVVATDSTDHKASFSAYGAFAAVSAPGVAIISPYYAGGYAVWSGTSMAAPFVSGEAALLFSTTPDLISGDPAPSGTAATVWPEMWASFVERRIRDSTTPIDGLNPRFAGGMGSGRIDLLQALEAGGGGGAPE